MKISQEDAILIKNLSAKVVWCMTAVEWIAQQELETCKLGSINVLLKRIHKTGTTVHQPAVADCIHHVAVEDLVLSQDRRSSQKGIDQIARFRMKLAFSIQVCTGQFIAISCSNASNDVVLSCCLKPITSPISLADKQPYHLQ